MQVEKLLVDGKAKKEDYLSGLATHVIVTDFSNVEVEEAKEVWQIPTVTVIIYCVSQLWINVVISKYFLYFSKLFQVKWIELSHLCSKLLPYPFETVAIILLI